LERFRGNDPTVRSSLRAAWQHIGSLFKFAAFSYTIGYILSEIANRVPFLGGKIVAWLADAAWRVASFFAIPVIMNSEEPVGPIKATKQSIGIIKQVWGESLIVSASIGLMAFLLSIGYMVLTAALFVGLASLSLPGLVYGILAIPAFLGIVVLILVFSVLESFVKTAIYHYAVTGESPAEFSQQVLRQAFTVKKARKVFSA
jgi:uncharacterized membrane protein